MSTPVAHRVEVAPGVWLPYVIQGAGTPVVLVHGLGDSSRSFEPVLAHLGDDAQVLAPSLRGHGDADRPDGDYGHDVHARDLAALLDHAGTGPAVIGGHSSGAQVALRFALDHPDRTRGLVLIGAPWPAPGHPAVAAVTADIEALTDPIGRDWARRFLESTVARALPEPLVETLVEGSANVPARVYQANWSAIRDFDVRDELHRITFPTLLVWGDLDAVPIASRQDQDRYVAALPDAELVIRPGCGHSPHLEDPAWFAAELTDFLRRLR